MRAVAMLVALLLSGTAAFPPFAMEQDRLKVEGIDGGDSVVVMVNARLSPGTQGCGLDPIARSNGESSHGNLLAGCKPWIAVLSKGNAMLLTTPEPKWTNAPGDQRSVTLEPIIDVPVMVWIVDPRAADKAVDDMANARLIFEENRVGIDLKPVFKNVPAESADVLTDGIVITGDGEFKCRNLRQIQQSEFYVESALNVYYVRKRAITGRNCAITPPKGDGNISFIGSAANRATLAHELGHAFGLRPVDDGGHTDGLPGFTSGNVMTGNGSEARDRFTAGQVFRMNTHKDRWGGTMLIRNRQRSGPGIECPPQRTSEQCPPLEADPPLP